MTTSSKFVCAFRGRRDSYQVPLALAEAGRLDGFITDAYATPLVRALAARTSNRGLGTLLRRREPGIPDELVECLWGTTLREHARHRLGRSKRLTWLTLDRRFSEAAAARARRHRADLFLYSPYAWEAFVASYPHQPRRILFQYHPHPALEARLLGDDAAKYPAFAESFAGPSDQVLPESLLRRERDCWRHADAIVCSSAFTKRSLVEAGCSEAICHVLPYGIDVPAAGAGEGPAGAFRALFVGSGGRRKGLHHLLLAWQQAALPASSTLTLVCRAIDRGIETLAGKTRGVEIVRGVPEAGLEQLYRSSTLFVMPSLVEGFGQVYLEALACGCPVLGTHSTGLPDLGSDADGVFLSPAGDVDALAGKLEALAARLPGHHDVRASARATAARYPWTRFREGIRALLP